MAFRADSFLGGINAGLTLGERLQGIKDKRDMREVANSKPVESTGYTAEDGEQLQGLANAKDPSGKPYYSLTADESGSYSVTPNKDAQGFGLSEAKPAKIEPRKVTDFMGERTAGTMSEPQVRSKKQAGLADIVSRSDPERADRMRRDAVRAEREDAKWTAEEKAASQEQDFKTQYRNAYGNTIYGRRMSEYTPAMEAYQAQLRDYKAQLEAGVSPEKLGPAPVEPAKPSYSVAESIADQGALLNLKLQAGKANPEEVSKFAQTIKTVQDEGYAAALQAAQSGAPLESIADSFNQSGRIKFDPKAVTSDKTVKKADGMTTRLIEIKDPATGQKQTINTLSELDAIGKAKTYYDRFVSMANAETADGRGERTMAEIRARGEEDRKTIDYRRTTGADKAGIGREERLRYTSLFQDAGRRQSEAQKSLNTLMKERSYANAKPGTPQYEELQTLRESIKQYGDERRTYQTLLANGGESEPGLSSVKTPNASERGMAEQVKGGMGADPAAIRREIAAAKADLPKVQDEASKKMLTDHIANMERQLANVSGQGAGLSAMKPAGSANQLPKIATAAEHAALPKGTRYTAPDGSVRIKQ